MNLAPPTGLGQYFKHLEGPNAELADFHAFLRDRFRSGPEAAAYLGGPGGHEANLNAEEFARAIRMSGYPQPPAAWDAIFLHAGNGSSVRVSELLRGSGLPTQNVGPALSPAFSSRPALSPVLQPRVMPEPRIMTEAPRMMEPRVVSPAPRVLADGRRTAAPQVASPRASPRFAKHSGAGEETPVYSYGMREEVSALRQEVSSLDAAARMAASVQALEAEARGREADVAPLRTTVARLEESTTALRGDSSDTRAALVETRRSLAEERNERQGEVTTISGRLQEVRKFAEDRASRESQTREVQLTELDTRWRGIQNEEKQQRLADNDALSRQVQEEMRTRQSESQLLGNRLDELREAFRIGVAEEARTRLSETQMLNSRLEEVRDGLRAGLAEAAKARETVERALGDRLAAQDMRVREECSHFVDRLREECSAREAADRDAESQRVDLRDHLLRNAQSLEELRIQAGQRFDEERRERIDADRVSAEATAEATEQALDRLREEAAHSHEQSLQGLQRLGTIISDEAQRRDAADQNIATRIEEDEGALQTEKVERDDSDRALAGRLAEIDADLGQFHSTVSQSLKNLEELPEAFQRVNSQLAMLSQKVDEQIMQLANAESEDKRAINQIAAAETADRRGISKLQIPSEVTPDRRAIGKLVAEVERRVIGSGTSAVTTGRRAIDAATYEGVVDRAVIGNAFSGARSEAATPCRVLLPGACSPRARRPSPERERMLPPPTVAELRSRTPPPLDRWSLPADRITVTGPGLQGKSSYNWNPSNVPERLRVA